MSGADRRTVKRKRGKHKHADHRYDDRNDCHNDGHDDHDDLANDNDNNRDIPFPHLLID